jgi:hypothetical protein
VFLPRLVTLSLLAFQLWIAGDLDNEKFYFSVSLDVKRTECSKEIVNASCPEIFEIAAVDDAVVDTLAGGL